MRRIKPQNLYESPDFQAFTEGMLRPGGLQTTKYAVRLAQMKAGQSLLDIGCGCGATTAFLQRQGIRAVGIDCSEALLLAGKGQNPGVELRFGKAEQLPFGENAFDVVLMECTLSVFGNPKKAVQEARRVLRPGGKLVCCDLYQRRGGNPEKGITLSAVTSSGGIKTKRDLCSLFRKQGLLFCTWQDCASIYKSFIATAIMKYGSLPDFLQRVVGGCQEAACGQALPGKQKLSYYISVWQKPNQ